MDRRSSSLRNVGALAMQRNRLAVEPPPSGVAEEEAVVPKDPELGQFGYTHKEPQLPVAISTGMCMCVSLLPPPSLAPLHTNHNPINATASSNRSCLELQTVATK